MAIHKISIRASDYTRLEDLILTMPGRDVTIMRADEYPDGDAPYTVVYLRLEQTEDLSYILLMVGGTQLRHP